MGCGMGCVRCLLFFANVGLWLTGIALVAVGALVLNSFGSYLSFTDKNFPHAAVFIIAVGVLVFIIGFLGCCGAITGNYCMLMSFSILMGIVFVLEVVAGILAFAYKGKINDEGSKALSRGVKNYDAKDENNKAAAFMDRVQRGYQCCGKNGPKDYSDEGKEYPISCCGKYFGECKKIEIYQKGCEKDFEIVLGGSLRLVGGISIGIASSHLMLIIFACCYMRSIKRKEQDRV